MNNTDRHLILYARGKYEEDDQIEDVRMIIHKTSNIPLKKITRNLFDYALLKAVLLFGFAGPISFSCFLDEYCENSTRACLSLIAAGQLEIDLPEPDPDILPLNTVSRL